MNSFSIQRFLNNLFVRRLSESEFNQTFQVGKVMNARVLRNFGGQRFLLHIANFNFLAASSFALKRGQLVKVRVHAKKPYLHLKIISQISEKEQGATGVAAIEPSVTDEFSQTAVFYFSLLPSLNTSQFRVAYFPQRKDKKKASISKFKIFLDFARSGRTEIDIIEHDKTLLVQFVSENDRWLQHLQKDFNDLQKELSAKFGTKTVNLQTRNNV